MRKNARSIGVVAKVTNTILRKARSLPRSQARKCLFARSPFGLAENGDSMIVSPYGMMAPLRRLNLIIFFSADAFTAERGRCITRTSVRIKGLWEALAVLLGVVSEPC